LLFANLIKSNYSAAQTTSGESLMKVLLQYWMQREEATLISLSCRLADWRKARRALIVAGDGVRPVASFQEVWLGSPELLARVNLEGTIFVNQETVDEHVVFDET
jgi:hypothetical protein